MHAKRLWGRGPTTHVMKEFSWWETGVCQSVIWDQQDIFGGEGREGEGLKGDVLA